MCFCLPFYGSKTKIGKKSFRQDFFSLSEVGSEPGILEFFGLISKTAFPPERKSLFKISNNIKGANGNSKIISKMCFCLPFYGSKKKSEKNHFGKIFFSLSGVGSEPGIIVFFGLI